VDWSPRALRRQARRLERAISCCKARLGRDPSEVEIAAELEVSLDSLQHLRGDLRGLDIESLQSSAEDSGGEPLDSLARSEDEDPYQQALRSEMSSLLELAITELPAREREVLALYHFQELTMKEVGEVLCIGESRVSQIHSAALSRLRAKLLEIVAKPSQAKTTRRPEVAAQRKLPLMGPTKTNDASPLKASRGFVQEMAS
jgi:RNA polymerase sigma factor for flagellar operon FliA